MTQKDPGGLQIPNKLYFRIGEVSEITGVQPYTLRHWEMEFPTLTPKKNDSGQRLYRKEDIEMVHTIQRLLHSEGYTTAGARRLLIARRGTRRAAPAPAPPKPAPSPPASPESHAAAPPPPKQEETPATLSAEALDRVRAALRLMDANDERLGALETAPED